MRNENFDQKIKERLLEETNYHPSLKEDIWNKIDAEIEKDKKVVTIPERSKKEREEEWFEEGYYNCIDSRFTSDCAYSSNDRNRKCIHQSR
ncbi:hypothetical protein KHA80_05890 [Anaerobacillus sp. HL2]|nr:hypothetical protein KHA80_05890 [Anaerobacillus sp. HL2]